MYWNRKVGSFWGQMLSKLASVLKNASNKYSIKLNFLQITRGRMSLSAPLGTKICHFLK